MREGDEPSGRSATLLIAASGRDATRDRSGGEARDDVDDLVRRAGKNELSCLGAEAADLPAYANQVRNSPDVARVDRIPCAAIDDEGLVALLVARYRADDQHRSARGEGLRHREPAGLADDEVGLREARRHVGLEPDDARVERLYTLVFTQLLGEALG